MELYEKIKENKYILKMVVLGDVGVGKTNIIRRIIGQKFEELEPTVGVEFTYVDINDIDPDDPDKKLSIQIWDTCIYINIIIYIYKISWS
jgi:GTPase SAR1 family protein